METIQIVLDRELLKAADRAARRRRVNRSALVREALREHLKRLATLENEHRDRRGYAGCPDDGVEFGVWDEVAEWPEE